MNFSDLHLIPALLEAVRQAGYEAPSPIQEQAIPPVLAGRDLLGCAQTGTGKTAAFALPILQRLAAAKVPGKPIRTLILTPTRELALQIDESFAAYGKGLPLTHCVIFGGVGQAPQVAALRRGVDILTATPGRLNDLCNQGHIDLSRVEVFVLDEADRMLDMGFVHDVKKVLARLPKRRQTLLFSATMPTEIEELAGTILHEPAKVMVTPPATTVEAIEQSLCFVDKGNKKHLLAQLLKDPQVESALVFTRTKHGADRVVKELSRAGVEAMAIHGNKSQTARQKALGLFKEGRLRVLVATDIAARGIDVSGLSHVFNYDLPNIPETYVHRIGRTGRAGKPGIAVSFCCAEELPYLSDIEKLTKQKIPTAAHDWPMQEATPPAAPEKERRTMPTEEQKQPLTPAADGESPAKKRRRRGGRRHSKKPGEAAAPQAQAQAAPAPRKPAPEKPAASQRFRPEKKAARQPAPKAPAPKAAAPQTAPVEEDNSIQVISRRAPAQKFTSFDDYMKAHGLSGEE